MKELWKKIDHFMLKYGGYSLLIATIATVAFFAVLQWGNDYAKEKTGTLEIIMMIKMRFIFYGKQMRETLQPNVKKMNFQSRQTVRRDITVIPIPLKKPYGIQKMRMETVMILLQ